MQWPPLAPPVPAPLIYQNFKYLPVLSFFKVHMKRGVFEAVFVDTLEPIAVTNIKKAVVATVNMDLSASR